MLEIRLPLPRGIISPIESFRVLFNLLFTVSEQHQAYRYTRFYVAISPESYTNYIFIAILLVAIILVAYIIVMQWLKSKVMCICIFLLVTGVQIYFGVFASPVWSIAFYAVIAYTLLPNAKLSVFAGATTAIVLIVFLFSLGKSPLLAELSESIRDMFGDQVERPIYADLPPQYQNAGQQMQDLQMRADAIGQGNQPGGNLYNIELYDRFTGSQIGTAIGQRIWLLWLIGLAFAIGFILWFMAKVFMALKRLKTFKSINCNLAINAMFTHSIDWLVEFGVKPQNLAFCQYADQIDEMFTGRLAKDYVSAVKLWQEAVYSNNTMTENDKKHMQIFLNETKQFLITQTNFFVRPLVRLRLLLRISI